MGGAQSVLRGAEAWTHDTTPTQFARPRPISPARAEVSTGPGLNGGGTGACRPACRVAVPGFRVPGLLGQAPGPLLWLAVRLHRQADPQNRGHPPVSAGPART